MFPNQGEYALIMASFPSFRQAAVEDALPDVLHLGVWCVVSAVRACTTHVSGVTSHRSLVARTHAQHTH